MCPFPTSQPKGQRHCARWGIKVPTPTGPYKASPLLYTLRAWRGLHLINHSFWDNTGLPQPNDSHIFWWCPGLGFFVGPLPTVSLGDDPAKPTECPAQPDGHMLTFHHQGSRPISWRGEGEQGQVSGRRPMVYGGAVQPTLGKQVKGSLLSFPHDGKLISVIRNLCLSEPFRESPWRWGTSAGTLLGKHQNKARTVCKWQKI